MFGMMWVLFWRNTLSLNMLFGIRAMVEVLAYCICITPVTRWQYVCVFAVCSSPAKVLACCGDMQPGQGWCPRLVFKQPGHGVIVLVGVEMAIGAMLFVGENLVWWYHVIGVDMAYWCHVEYVVAACVVFFFQVVALMLCFTMMCPLRSSSLLKYSYVCWSEFSAVDIGNFE